jgi:hypothetical protein
MIRREIIAGLQIDDKSIVMAAKAQERRPRAVEITKMPISSQNPLQH